MEYNPHFPKLYERLLMVYSDAIKPRDNKEEIKVYVNAAYYCFRTIELLQTIGLFSPADQKKMCEDFSAVIEKSSPGVFEPVQNKEALSSLQRTFVCSAVDILLSEFEPQ